MMCAGRTLAAGRGRGRGLGWLAGVWLLVAQALPVSGQPVDTSLVRIGPADRGTRAYVASPGGKGPWPGVVLIHEWWGLNVQIRDVARRLAREGYVVIVPDLYHGKVATEAEQAHVLMRGLEDEQVLDELDAAARWLRADRRVGKRKTGVMGFCMGGSYALRLALQDAELSAVVMFYGRPETDSGKLAALRAPLQGHFGERDEGIPLARVEALRAGMEKAGKPVEIYVYPGAGHAFLNEARPSYHADAARQAWARTLAFFQKHLRS